MAKDLNKVMLIGRLGADPEARYTPSGQMVCTMRVASGRGWRDQAGNAHEETEWFRVVAWDKLGETCNQWLTKGARVYFEGRLRTNKWQDKDGQDRYTTEVIAADMIMLDTRPKAERDPGIPDEEPSDEDVFFPPPRPAAAAPAGPTPSAARVPGVRRSSAGAVRNIPQPVDDDEDLPF